MKRKSLSQRITNYLAIKNDWICGGELQRLAMEAGYEAQNCGRRLRELENDSLVQVEYRKGQNGQNVAWYKTMTPKVPTTYFVPGLNKKIEVYG